MTKFSSAMIAATLWMKQYAFLMSVPMTKHTKPSDNPIHLSISISNSREEIFKVIYLNSANVVLAAENLFKGTVEQSAVYPREIIKRAFELNVSGLIFVHNHPSGDLKPSRSYLSLKEKLNNACKAVDLTPLDHLIMGSSGYVSL